MSNGIQATLKSLTPDQVESIYKEIMLIKLGNIGLPSHQKMTNEIYCFLEKTVKSRLNIKNNNELDIIDLWKEDMILIIMKNFKIKKELKPKRDLILSEMAKLGTVVKNYKQMDENIEALSRDILLLLFYSLNEKEQKDFIQEIKKRPEFKDKLADDMLDKIAIEAILKGAPPVALGVAAPLVAGVILNALSNGFLITVILPAILSLLGINLASLTGVLAVAAGPIGWGIAGSVILGSVFFSGSNFFNQRDKVLFIRTIFSIYVNRYYNRLKESGSALNYAH